MTLNYTVVDCLIKDNFNFKIAIYSNCVKKNLGELIKDISLSKFIL